MGLLFEFTFARRQTRTHVEIFFECGSTKFLKTYTDIALNWMNSRCESRIQPKKFICPTSQLLYAYIFAYLTLRLPSRLIRTCPQPRSYSATGGAQARAELPKKWKVFYTVDFIL
jgi:hypothetical protein